MRQNPVTEVKCNGDASGTITLSVTGGTAPYEFVWSNGSSDQDLTDLIAGVYQVTITDINACSFVTEFTVTQPAEALSATGISTDVSCHGEASGTITLSVTGGTAPYEFVWSNGSSDQDLTDLSAGVYQVTITDINACSFVSEFTVTEPAEALSVTGISTDVSCHGEASGTITLSVTGGTAPYEFVWSNGSTTQDQTDLPSGVYQVTITDINGCSFVSEFTVTEPTEAISATGVATDVSCSGEANGSITLTVTGGTAPYLFAWSNGSTNQNLTDLSGGVYQVDISDANACTYSTEYTVVEPDDAIDATGTITNISCAGEANGSIALSVSGGTAPYQFVWSNGSSDQDLANLMAGVYQVTISDVNACSFVTEFTVTEPLEALGATGSVTDATCFGEATGTITLSVIGGTAPYEFDWSNGSTTQDQNGVMAGDYQVSITDANGCTFASEFTVTEPAEAISASATTTDISCMGEADGGITLTVSGGVAPYQFAWSNGSTTQNLTDLMAGDYQVTITDANGCSFDTEFTVTEPAEALDAMGTVTDVSCMGEANGSIILSATGGTVPYTFVWSNGSVTRDQNGLVAGVYQVTVTDENGCSFATEFTVTEPTEPLSVSGVTNEVSCSGEGGGSIELSVFGGTPPYQYSWSNGSTTQNLEGVSSGMYQVTITDANACTTVWSGEVRAQSKATLSGYARHSNGYVTADEADVVLYEASSLHNHPVAEMRIGPDGAFSFADIPEGQYILHVKLDNHDKKTYQGVMSSYYGKAWNWQGAEIIALSCDDTEAIVVDMFENHAATVGDGKAGGKVKHELTSLKATPLPVVDAQVFLIDEFNGLPVGNISTDEIGDYIFTDVAIGDYSLYVDIPGITQETTHYFSITETELEKMNLDFVVDAIVDLDINSVLNTSIPEIADILSSIKIFPNPTISDYVILQSELLDRKKVEVVIISDVGSVMLQRDIYVVGDQIKLDLYGFVPGNYIVRLKVEDQVQYKKLIVFSQ